MLSRVYSSVQTYCICIHAFSGLPSIMPGLKRHLLIPVTAALSRSRKPLDFRIFESATRPSSPIRNCSVTVPVSSLRREAFGHSGFAQVLKSATAATRTGFGLPAGAAGAAGACGRASSFDRRLGRRRHRDRALRRRWLLHVHLDWRDERWRRRLHFRRRRRWRNFLRWRRCLLLDDLGLHCFSHLGDHALAETGDDPIGDEHVQDDDNGDAGEILPGLVYHAKNSCLLSPIPTLFVATKPTKHDKS